jgi:predicted metal-dependent HD superfamily phosphohydrolase
VTPELEAAYAEPHRRYHNRRHVEACLALLDEWPGIPERERRLLAWAIWWHDAIYDPRASDNEARSAELARRDLPHLGASADDADEVARLIRLTADHVVAEDDRLGAVLVSIDLAILATPPPVYEAYARAVREEYAHVPDDAWRAARAAVLQRFLDAPVIFPHPGFREAHEAQARANLTREMERLGQGWPPG